MYSLKCACITPTRMTLFNDGYYPCPPSSGRFWTVPHQQTETTLICEQFHPLVIMVDYINGTRALTAAYVQNES